MLKILPKRTIFKCFSIFLIFSIFLLLIHSWRVHSKIGNCVNFLFQNPISIPILIVDQRILLENQNCENLRNIEVTIDDQYKSHIFTSQCEINIFKNFKILYFKNDPSKDYLEFHTDVKRIIPKNLPFFNIGNYQIPWDSSLFQEFWKRSRYQKCLGLDMKRDANETKVLDPIRSTQILADLRDELIQHKMFPFLGGGTLLGWFRECSIIPHTTDIDMIVPIDQYNPNFLEKLLERDSKFLAYRKLGLINDSLEITVIPSTWFPRKFNLDIFFMYPEKGTTGYWTSGVSEKLMKFKYSFPFYDPWCAVDLHGHIFWATCSPDQILTVEFGDWRTDLPSNKFSWTSSQKNVQPNGNFPMEMKKDVLVFYRQFFFPL